MIKTNIKMRVNPEQSKKVQEICFENGINWGFNDNQIRYTEEPFILIKDSLSWLGYKQEDCFNDLEEINANFFIRTNGTCIEEKEFTYPMWFKNKNHTGLIVRFDDIDVGICIASSNDILDDWKVGERCTRIVEHTNKDFWEQIENPNEHLDRLDDTFKEREPIIEDRMKQFIEDIKKENNPFLDFDKLVKEKNNKEDSHNAHYKAQKIDTIARCKANMTLEQQKAICIFSIDKYTHREKDQNLADIQKVRYYLDWLEDIEKQLKDKE